MTQEERTQWKDALLQVMFQPMERTQLYFELNKLALAPAQSSDPERLCEMWSIYLDVMTEIATPGLDKAYCMAYLDDETCLNQVGFFFDGGYNVALTNVMRGVEILYEIMATRPIRVTVGGGRREDILASEPNWMALKTDAGEYADGFESTANRLYTDRPKHDVFWQKGALEQLDELFNHVYESVQCRTRPMKNPVEAEEKREKKRSLRERMRRCFRGRSDADLEF